MDEVVTTDRTGRSYSKDDLILECDVTRKSDSVIDKIIEAAESDE